LFEFVGASYTKFCPCVLNLDELENNSCLWKNWPKLGTP